MTNDQVIGQFLYGYVAENKSLSSCIDRMTGSTVLRSYNTLIGTRYTDNSVSIFDSKTSSTTSKHISALKKWADRWQKVSPSNRKVNTVKT